MPKEAVIRKKAIQMLTKEKWVCWFPKKVKFHETDVFGIIDVLALKGKRQKNVQLTTLPNISAKRKKITNFLNKFKVELPVEIWGWNQKKKIFKKETVNLRIKKSEQAAAENRA